MGGVSRPDPWGIGQGVGAVGAVGSPAEVPQAPPRPEEAQAQATERGEGQACRHREDSKSPSYVYKLTHPRGWYPDPTLRPLLSPPIFEPRFPSCDRHRHPRRAPASSPERRRIMGPLSRREALKITAANLAFADPLGTAAAGQGGPPSKTFDVVFEGGGIKGAAMAGALEEFEESGFG